MTEKKARILGIIPARLESTRFKQKLIQKILDKPLIQYTYENAKKITQLDHLVILTDDPLIKALCQSCKAPCVLTPKE